MSAPSHPGAARAPAAESAAARAAARLVSLQRADGHWCGELTADSTLESDFILFQLWLYPPRDGRWDPPTAALIAKAARSILDRQLADGGFNIFAGGPSDVSASVKAYCALKLSGLAASDPRMARLARRILDLGGVQAANSYVKINLSLFGLFPRRYCPTIPPELILMPFRFVYRMSAWTRAIAVSLSIVQSANLSRPAPAGFALDEIRALGVSPAFTWDRRWFTWKNAFLAGDRFLKWWERRGLKAVRRAAVGRAAAWMMERLEGSDGLGAIYPPMMYSVMALDALGYAPDHPLRLEALRQFNNLMVHDGERFFFQPCFSPVWDTAIAAYALARSGGHAASLLRACYWLDAREIRRRGDWAVARPRVEPSGWAFEYRNEFYPDLDDTAMVLLALADTPARLECARRAAAWLTAMQCRDGGWGAFDADNNWRFLQQVPFADHNAMLDPACPDITGRALEALAAHGAGPGEPAIRRGVQWLVRNQRPDGSWYGRWGVAYIYGTCFALRGLAAAGESDREAHVLRAGEWLRSIQNADGGWGESCQSYRQGGFVAGPSTPSQTAWAILGLIAGGDAGSLSVRSGIEYLLETQRQAGDWDETPATGTGFPGVFYLNYHLYRLYFPLLALTAFRQASAGADVDL